MKKLLNIVGARPNFIKIAPLISAMDEFNHEIGKTVFSPILIHTGQHYDPMMSDAFFKDLEIPKPDLFLGVGSGSHAEQTAKIMVAFEKICEDIKPDLVLVVGDVNSTLACSLVASKLGIPIAHVEAGLRSFDRSMPEEINRLVTDAVSNYLFVSEEVGVQNLLKEGKNKKDVFFVGNVMIDTLFKYRKKSSESSIIKQIGATPKSYGVVTLHRPSNVDQPGVFKPILETLSKISEKIPLFFPIHPRTRQQIEKWGLDNFFSDIPSNNHGLYWMGPLGYLDFLCLMDNARIVLTDSGGIQEETTALGVPCLTLRENTERPATITAGTNQLVGMQSEQIFSTALQVILNEKQRIKPKVPELWDGKTSNRILQILKQLLYS